MTVRRIDSGAIDTPSFEFSEGDLSQLKHGNPSPAKIVDGIVHGNAQKPTPLVEQQNAQKASWGLEALSPWMPWNWFASEQAEISILDSGDIEEKKYSSQDMRRLLDHWQEVANQTHDEFKNDLVSVFRMMMRIMSRQRELAERGVELDIGMAREMRKEKKLLATRWQEFRRKYEDRVEGKYWLDRIQEGLQTLGLLGVAASEMGTDAITPAGVLRLLVAGSVLIDDMLGAGVQKSAASLLARASAWINGKPKTADDERSWLNYVTVATHLVGPLAQIASSSVQQARQNPNSFAQKAQRYGGAALAWTQAGAQLVNTHTEYQLNRHRADELVSSAEQTNLNERYERLMSGLSQEANRSNDILREQFRMAQQELEVQRQMLTGA